jgi:hypothetical protein
MDHETPTKLGPVTPVLKGHVRTKRSKKGTSAPVSDLHFLPHRTDESLRKYVQRFCRVQHTIPNTTYPLSSSRENSELKVPNKTLRSVGSMRFGEFFLDIVHAHIVPHNI